jgi:hypothetical protein
MYGQPPEWFNWDFLTVVAICVVAGVGWALYRITERLYWIQENTWNIKELLRKGNERGNLSGD